MPFKMFFIDENNKKVIVHSKAKGEIHWDTFKSIKHVFYDEDGYQMKTADEIRDFNRRMCRLDKRNGFTIKKR